MAGGPLVQACMKETAIIIVVTTSYLLDYQHPYMHAHLLVGANLKSENLEKIIESVLLASTHTIVTAQ